MRVRRVRAGRIVTVEQRGRHCLFADPRDLIMSGGRHGSRPMWRPANFSITNGAVLP